MIKAFHDPGRTLAQLAVSHSLCLIYFDLISAKNVFLNILNTKGIVLYRIQQTEHYCSRKAEPKQQNCFN